jgi:hypothetical protein
LLHAALLAVSDNVLYFKLYVYSVREYPVGLIEYLKTILIMYYMVAMIMSFTHGLKY